MLKERKNISKCVFVCEKERERKNHDQENIFYLIDNFKKHFRS